MSIIVKPFSALRLASPAIKIASVIFCDAVSTTVRTAFRTGCNEAKKEGRVFTLDKAGMQKTREPRINGTHQELLSPVDL